MNVVVLSGISRSAGGLFYAVSSLCRALQAGGMELSAIGRHDVYSEEDRDAWTPVPVRAYTAVGSLGFSFELRRLLQRDIPDMVHVHGIWLDDQWAALHWQKRTKRPVVISPHGMLDPWALKNSAWKKKLVGALFANKSLRSATCIHALCQSELESIRAYGLKNPVALIPNGVELPDINSSNFQLPTANRPKRLLFLGRIHPKKGLSELLRGWAKAKSQKSKDFSNWQLLIAGWDDGNHLAGLKQLASQLDLSWSDEAPSPDLRPPASTLCPLSSDLCFIGPQFGDEKDTLLRRVDAFILPSFSEGLPMSVLEAWSYGLPVVMTPFCNLPEGYETDAALKIAPDPDSIALGLRHLSEMDHTDLITMGNQGRMLVEKHFTWEKIAQDMKEVYGWCLGGEKPTCIQEG